MKKTVLLGIAIGIVAVIVALALVSQTLAGAKGGVELNTMDFTTETGVGWPDDKQSVTVTDQNGWTYTMYVQGYPITTYINVTVTVHNTSPDYQEFNMTAVVTDSERGLNYSSADRGSEFSIGGDDVRQILMIVTIPRELQVERGDVHIFINGQPA